MAIPGPGGFSCQGNPSICPGGFHGNAFARHPLVVQSSPGGFPGFPSSPPKKRKSPKGQGNALRSPPAGPCSAEPRTAIDGSARARRVFVLLGWEQGGSMWMSVFYE